MAKEQRNYSTSSEDLMQERIDDKRFAQKILHRIKELERIRNQRESIWNAIMHAVDPFWEETKHKYEQYGAKGLKYYNGKFSTAYKGIFGSLIERAVLTLTSQMIDPSISWLDLKLLNYKDEKNTFLRDYLKELINWTYGVTNNPESGFYTSSPIIVGNAYQLGVGSRYCSYSDEETAQLPEYGYKTALNFDSIDPRFFVFSRNARSKLDFYARKLVLSLEDAVELWGTAVIQAAYPNGINLQNVNMYEVIRKYYHVVIPNPYLGQGSNNLWMELVIDIEKGEIVTQGFLAEMPYTVWTFLPESYGGYGRSPAYFLAKNILAAENYSEEIIKAADFINNPAWFIAKGANPKLQDLMPGARILDAMSQEGHPLMTRAPVGENLPTAGELFKMEKQDIAEGLIIRDLSQNFNQSGLTETLVAEQRAAADNQLKPIINRWVAQDLYPTVKFILKYLSKPRLTGGADENGKPQLASVVEFPYKQLGIEPEQMPDPVEALGIYYAGLLGRQQDRYEDYMVSNMVMETAQMSQANPPQGGEALQLISLEKAVRAKAELKHFRTDILRSEEELEALAKQQRQAQAAQQLQQEQMMGQAIVQG
jgi:hypothetical protein